MKTATKTRFRVKHSPVSQGRAEQNPSLDSGRARKKKIKL